jgi:excisionase family DNA binding protein
MTFYTVEQVSEKLDISVQMARYFIRQKRIKAVKHGRKYVVSEDDLNKAIKKGY